MSDDDAVRRTTLHPTSFSIEDIICADSAPRSVDHCVVVRPWEKQTGSATKTWLTAAAAAAYVTLYHWQQAINSSAAVTAVPVSPLCALYQMTNSNFLRSLNADSFQGWEFAEHLFVARLNLFIIASRF